MDKQDSGLNLKSRKQKWLLVLAVLLLIFILSFILFPGSQPDYEALEQQLIELNQEMDQTPVHHSLDMPVDTFEQLLKRKIHERVSKGE
jgi:flagellar biosynthesis/type III secretory pathway M-ring protein FliF/YscJ